MPALIPNLKNLNGCISRCVADHPAGCRTPAAKPARPAAPGPRPAAGTRSCPAPRPAADKTRRITVTRRHSTCTARCTRGTAGSARHESRKGTGLGCAGPPPPSMRSVTSTGEQTRRHPPPPRRTNGRILRLLQWIVQRFKSSRQTIQGFPANSRLCSKIVLLRLSESRGTLPSMMDHVKPLDDIEGLCMHSAVRRRLTLGPRKYPI